MVLLLLVLLLQVRDPLNWWLRRLQPLHHRLRLLPAHLWLQFLSLRPGTPLRQLLVLALRPGYRVIRNWWVHPGLDWIGSIEPGELVSGHERLPTGEFQLPIEPLHWISRAATTRRFVALVWISLLCSTPAGSYWQAIGDLSTSPSISHAFPSQTEARVYLAGAGVVDFDIRQ